MSMIVPLDIVLLVFIPMIIESRRAARNERAQLARGGIEPPGDVYSIMRFAYPGAFLAMIAERAIRGGPSAATVSWGIGVFIAAKALKWWAIEALGPCWTFRVIVVPGASRVEQGPYRVLRHPNYVAVVGELVGVWLMTGAAVSGPIVTIGFVLLMWKRAAVESAALDAILAPKRN